MGRARFEEFRQHLRQASKQGKAPAQVVEETVKRMLERRTPFLEGIQLGKAATRRYRVVWQDAATKLRCRERDESQMVTGLRITHQMRYACCMRTTLDIDDEVLLTIKQIAQQQKTTAGSVVSTLLRESLQPKSFAIEFFEGVPVLPRRPNSPVITTELVNRILNEGE